MRKILLSSIIIVIAITFLGRLSYLQIFSFSAEQVLEDPQLKLFMIIQNVATYTIVMVIYW